MGEEKRREEQRAEGGARRETKAERPDAPLEDLKLLKEGAKGCRQLVDARKDRLLPIDLQEEFCHATWSTPCSDLCTCEGMSRQVLYRREHKPIWNTQFDISHL